MDLRYKQWIIYAKFDSKCEETGRKIREGDQVLYLPPVKGICPGRVFCQESKEYKRWENHIDTGWRVNGDKVDLCKCEGMRPYMATPDGRLCLKCDKLISKG